MIRMVWSELINTLPDVTFLAEPAAESAIDGAEQALGHGLPRESAALLRESNGVLGEHGLGLIWSIERIVADNVALCECVV